MHRVTRLALGLAAGAAALAGTTACSTTLDTKDAAQKIKANLEGQRPDLGSVTVTCPDSVPGTKGTTFTCTLTASDGTTAPIKVTLTDDNGRFDFEVQSSSGGSSNGG